MTTSEQRARRTVRMQPGRDAPADWTAPSAPAGAPADGRRLRRHRAIESPVVPPHPVATRTLPPIGLIVARPVLLLICALVGAIGGFVLSGNEGYQAQAMLQFSTQSPDSVVVKQTGQTLARRVLSGDILAIAETSTGAPAGSFAGKAKADWEQDSNLVAVTVNADSEAGAVARANALANAVVQVTESRVQSELAQAHDDSSKLLSADELPSPAAEDARQAQVGQSLATRQDAIAARSGSVVVIDPAATATHAGITPVMGAAIGLVAGLLLGGLAAILLGVRGLRVMSSRSLRTLFPTYRITGAGESARLVGEILESGRECVAVVCPPGTRDAGIDLARDLTAFAGAHGHVVRNIGLVEDRSMALTTLTRDIRRDVSGTIGADIMVVVVDTDTEAAHLLEGQSDFAAVVVARRRRTSVKAVAAAMNAFDRAMPSLVLAR